LSQIGGGAAVTQQEGGAASTFTGNLEATENVSGQVHDLIGGGVGTHLGRFTYTAHIIVNPQTGEGTGRVTWTAANGDQIFADTTGNIVAIDASHIELREEQIVRGGTGRFADAAGVITVDRSLVFATHITAGSFTITLDR